MYTGISSAPPVVPGVPSWGAPPPAAASPVHTATPGVPWMFPTDGSPPESRDATLNKIRANMASNPHARTPPNREQSAEANARHWRQKVIAEGLAVLGSGGYRREEVTDNSIQVNFPANHAAYMDGAGRPGMDGQARSNFEEGDCSSGRGFSPTSADPGGQPRWAQATFRIPGPGGCELQWDPSTETADEFKCKAAAKLAQARPPTTSAGGFQLPRGGPAPTAPPVAMANTPSPHAPTPPPAGAGDAWQSTAATPTAPWSGKTDGAVSAQHVDPQPAGGTTPDTGFNNTAFSVAPSMQSVAPHPAPGANNTATASVASAWGPSPGQSTTSSNRPRTYPVVRGVPDKGRPEGVNVKMVGTAEGLLWEEIVTIVDPIGRR